MSTLDTARHTLAQARRMPQWQRLIDSIHKAQEAKGYDGRQFGKGEMSFFGETLIGKPAEVNGPNGFAAYWVARQVTDHSDGSESVRYTLKAVYGDDLANVHTIKDTTEDGTPFEDTLNPSAEWDARKAREYIARASHQIGR